MGHRAMVPGPDIIAGHAGVRAGHAVAAVLAGVEIKHVTINPTGDSAGYIVYLRPTRALNQVQKRSMVALAGEAAQRRFNPRSVRGHYESGDCTAVVNYALECSGSAEQAELLVRFWSIQARELVQARWNTIERVVAAHLKGKTWTHNEVHTIAMDFSA